MLLSLTIPCMVAFLLSVHTTIYHFYCYLLSYTFGSLHNKFVNFTCFSFEQHKFFQNSTSCVELHDKNPWLKLSSRVSNNRPLSLINFSNFSQPLRCYSNHLLLNLENLKLILKESAHCNARRNTDHAQKCKEQCKTRNHI